jgi:hypothetical protein
MSFDFRKVLENSEVFLRLADIAREKIAEGINKNLEDELVKSQVRMNAVEDKLLYLTSPVEGLIHDSPPDKEEKPKNKLNVYSFKDRKADVLIDALCDYTLSANGKRIAQFKGDGGRLRRSQRKRVQGWNFLDCRFVELRLAAFVTESGVGRQLRSAGTILRHKSSVTHPVPPRQVRLCYIS